MLPLIWQVSYLTLKRAQHIQITLSRFRHAREPRLVQLAVLTLDSAGWWSVIGGGWSVVEGGRWSKVVGGGRWPVAVGGR